MENSKTSIIKALFRKVVMFTRKWNELFLLPIALFTWFMAPVFLRWFDPTSAAYDAGVLHKFIYATVGTLICHFTCWFLLYMSFPNIHSYIYHRFEWDLFDQKPDLKSNQLLNEHICRRVKYSLLVWAFYLFTFIAILFSL